MINCGGYPVTHRCPSTIRIVSSWGFVWLSWCGRLYFLPLPWPQRTPQHLIWSPARDVLGDWTCLRASPGLAEPHCLYLRRLYPPQELPSLLVSCPLYSPSSPSLCVLELILLSVCFFLPSHRVFLPSYCHLKLFTEWCPPIAPPPGIPLGISPPTAL